MRLNCLSWLRPNFFVFYVSRTLRTPCASLRCHLLRFTHLPRPSSCAACLTHCVDLVRLSDSSRPTHPSNFTYLSHLARATYLSHPTILHTPFTPHALPKPLTTLTFHALLKPLKPLKPLTPLTAKLCFFLTCVLNVQMHGLLLNVLNE